MALPPNEGSSLGQRLLAAVTGGASSSSNGGAGAAAAGLKQYDVNELYIGDLPLSWDEDAVRRLLGRYGKVSKRRVAKHLEVLLPALRARWLCGSL
jgi:hypothetical protein